MYWSCCTIFPPKLKECDWKIRLTKVEDGNLKHELLNPLWSILAVNMLRWVPYPWYVNPQSYTNLQQSMGFICPLQTNRKFNTINLSSNVRHEMCEWAQGQV
jgi:hypothetical protein